MRVLPGVIASFAVAAGQAHATAAPTASVSVANDRTATAKKCLKQLLVAFGANGATGGSDSDADILALWKDYGPTSRYSEGTGGIDKEADCATATFSNKAADRKCDATAGTGITYGTTQPAGIMAGMTHASAVSGVSAASHLLTGAQTLKLFGDDAGATGATSAGGGMKISSVVAPTAFGEIAMKGSGSTDDLTGLTGTGHCVVTKPAPAGTNGFESQLFSAPTDNLVKTCYLNDIGGYTASGANAAATTFFYASGHDAAHGCTATKAGKSAGAVFNACTTLYAQEEVMADDTAGWKEVAKQTAYVDVLGLGHQYAKAAVGGNYMGTRTALLTTAGASGATRSACATTGATAASASAGSARFLGNSPCEANILAILKANGAIATGSTAFDADVLQAANVAAETAGSNTHRWAFRWWAAQTGGTAVDDTTELMMSFRSLRAERKGDVVAACYHADAYKNFGNTFGTVGNPRVTKAAGTPGSIACDWVEIVASGKSSADADATAKYACEVTTAGGGFSVGDVIMGDSENTLGYKAADGPGRLTKLSAKITAGAQFIMLQGWTGGAGSKAASLEYLHWEPKSETPAGKTCTNAVRTALKSIMDERCFVGTNAVNWKGAKSHYHAFNAAILATTPGAVDAPSGTALKTEILGIFPNMLKGCGWTAPADPDGGATPNCTHVESHAGSGNARKTAFEDFKKNTSNKCNKGTNGAWSRFGAVAITAVLAAFAF